MARSYTLRGLTAANGLALVNVWCRAFNATSDALVETAYTDSSGEASFTTLPDDANVNICCIPGMKGDKVTWLYNIFSAAQDLIIHEAIIENAQIGTCSIAKLTAGNLTVLGTITGSGGFQTAAAGNDRIVINTSYVAGYNSANALQFYLDASNGKAYCGAGSVILDASGIKIVGEFLTFWNGETLLGAIDAAGAATFSLRSDYDIFMKCGSDRVMKLGRDGTTSQVELGSYLRPTTTDTVDLGGASNKWKTICATNLDLTGTGYLDLPVRSTAPTWAQGRMYYNSHADYERPFIGRNSANTWFAAKYILD